MNKESAKRGRKLLPNLHCAEMIYRLMMNGLPVIFKILDKLAGFERIA